MNRATAPRHERWSASAAVVVVAWIRVVAETMHLASAGGWLRGGRS